MSGECPRDRQEEEVEVLRAIYDECLTDLRQNDVWKVKRPPEIELKLLPNHDSRGRLQPQDDCCWATLHVKFSPNYPEELPEELGVTQIKGKTKNLLMTKLRRLTSLNEELQQMSRRCIGEVMVTQIALHVSEWLTKQLMKQGPKFNSFYEEMEERKKAAEITKEREQAKKSERLHKEREAIREEVARRQEEIDLMRKEEVEHRRRLKTGSTTSEAKEASEQPIDGGAASTIALPSRRRSMSSRISESSETFPQSLEFDERRQVHFDLKGEKTTVKKLSILGKNALGGIVYLGLCEQDGKLLVMSEWLFRTKRAKKSAAEMPLHDPSQIIRQLASIEQELSSQQKLDHPNVIKYMALSHDKESDSIRVYVHEEFMHGSNLGFYLSENFPVDLDLLRHIVKSILEALSYMHEHNIVHRDLRGTSVFMDSKGTVRVTDFSIDKRVRDLLQQDKSLPETGRFPVAIGRGGKKTDVYRLGLLTLSLAQGEIAQSSSFPEDVFPPDFVDFLKRALDRDERERATSQELLQHCWIKKTVEWSPMRLATAAQGTVRPTSPELDLSAVTPAVPIATSSSGQSRLLNEFSYIAPIGEGGFGEVIKVKNNLDGQIYAIKKIKLNPKNKTVTRKIMREVKLLSRLNHENVVRYYTSWIEITTIMEESEETETSFDEDSSSVPATPRQTHPHRMPSLGENAILPSPLNSAKLKEKTAVDTTADWSVSFLEDSSSSSNEDEDEEDIFGTSILVRPESSQYFYPLNEDDDDDIVFEKSSQPSQESASSKNSSSDSKSEEEPESGSTGAKKPETRLMYIQMEYCDKQTLRNAIDDCLHKDSRRMWRMFREICEGLVHIHTQGMIHRDLKPVNIFIDSNDHVKIGDFGLATMNIMGTMDVKDSVYNNSTIGQEGSDLTGQIGTTLYIAPEINSTKVGHYSQKVDIYSLGIIFFEMCYPPLNTGMERIQVLTALRSPDVRLPDDFERSLQDQQVYLLQRLLDHDPSKRPSSQELLQSDYLPPPQVEEAEMKELVRHTLTNSQSKSYRHLIDSCLARNVKLSDDILYDTDMFHSVIQKGVVHRHVLAQEYVRRVIEKVFRRHGAMHLDVCHLLPKGEHALYDRQDLMLVELMTRSGAVVHLPYDLRVSFARFLARAHINHVRRYAIAPVFREVPVYGFHPKEELECAFDIVTPATGNLLADAEILYLVDELLHEFSIGEASYYIRLNHNGLLKGILSSCGVPEEQFQEIYRIIREGDRWSQSQRNTHLLNLGISEQMINHLFTTLGHECSIKKIQGILRHMVRKKTEASKEMKHALDNLESIIKSAEALGIRCDIVIAPSLVYNPSHFSGMICELVHKRKRRNITMAAGGRYDQLIHKFADNFSLRSDAGAPKEPKQSAVGISISLELIVSLITSKLEDAPLNAIDVAIYSVTQTSSIMREKARVASKLWSIGIKAAMFDVFQSLDEAQENAIELGVSFIVIFRDNEASVRLRCLLNRERFQEKKVALEDLPEVLSKQLKGDSVETGNSSVSSSSTATRADGSKLHPESVTSKALNIQVKYNVKLKSSLKSRFESTMSNKLNALITMFAPSARVEVIVLALPKSVLKAVNGVLDFGDENSFKKSVAALLDGHAKFRKDLKIICDDLFELKFNSEQQIAIILYSSEEHEYQVLIT